MRVKARVEARLHDLLGDLFGLTIPEGDHLDLERRRDRRGGAVVLPDSPGANGDDAALERRASVPHPGDRVVILRAGAHDDVERSEDLERARLGGRYAGGIAPVPHDVPRLASLVGDLTDRLAQRPLHGPGHDHLHAPRRQGQRDGPPRLFTAPHDEGDTPTQPAHDAPSRAGSPPLPAPCLFMPPRLTHAPGGRYTPRVPSEKRVAGVVYAAFVVLATAFVVSSTYQLARAVFADDGAPAPGLAGAPLPEACTSAIRELEEAVDRGLAAAATARTRESAERLYQEGRGPAWEAPRRQELERACGDAGQGAEALAAVARLDRAAEGASTAAAAKIAELAPVRRAVDSFIR